MRFFSHFQKPRFAVLMQAIAVVLPLWTVRGAVDFDHEIVPLLRQRCGDCHTGAKKKGGLSFNTRETLLKGGENGPVALMGKSAESKLIQVVTSSDPDEQMPPKGDRLSAVEVNHLREWIDGGLLWTDGFSFLPPSYEPPLFPRRPTLPGARAGRTNGIDRILDADLAARLAPTPPLIDDAGFLRRVSLDLVGLLPELGERQRFLDDPAPDKRNHLVHHLLTNDIAYAEHWLSFWNDLLRNDYSGTGFIDGGRKQITPWLYQALVENKPYDQFARELISPNAASEGYSRGIQWRGAVSAGQTVPVQFAQSVGQTFLGINLKCASCHDSFIDHWTLEDAYGLAAIYSDQPLELYRCDKATGRKAKAAWLFPELGQVDPAAPPSTRLSKLAELMTDPRNGRFTRTIVNRLWHRLMGRGIVHPVDAMQTAPWNADLLDFLASDLADHHYDLKHTLELICTSAAYQSRAEPLQAGQDEKGYAYRGPRTKRMTAEQFVDAVWQLTGTAPDRYDAPILRGRVDSAMKVSSQWIWAVTNPAPGGQVVTFRKQWVLAEVPSMVGAAITADNRYVLYVNGRKLQENDNWESVEFIALDGALRAGTNEIVVTATNGGDAPNPAGLYFEALWSDGHGEWKRLDADSTWEWTLGAADEHGSVPAPADWHAAVVVNNDVWRETVKGGIQQAVLQVTQRTPAMVRASLVNADLLQRALGRPNREQIVSMRPTDLSTLEAMDLSNGPLLAARLHTGAEKLANRVQSTDELLGWLYPAALGRRATTDELDAARELLGDKPSATGTEDLLWAVCMLPEFQFVR